MATLTEDIFTLLDALQGVRDVGRSPTLPETIRFPTETEGARDLGRSPTISETIRFPTETEGKGQKRKSVDEGRVDSDDAKLGNFKKAKKLAISMASTFAKGLKSDSSLVQERCRLLEEENRKLRDLVVKSSDDDDLVTLQLEALLEEKSRLACEIVKLTRDNCCLQGLVEYHQFMSQDVSSSKPTPDDDDLVVLQLEALLEEKSRLACEIGKLTRDNRCLQELVEYHQFISQHVSSSKEIITTPDDDDLVRLQLEELLAEKSRLANENENLTRENRCLHERVKYHKFMLQDVSAY